MPPVKGKERPLGRPLLSLSPTRAHLQCIAVQANPQSLPFRSFSSVSSVALQISSNFNLTHKPYLA